MLVERTADPSASLGMTKERAVVTVEDCFTGLKPDIFSIVYGTTQVVP
jgi:hypothetical protein